MNIIHNIFNLRQSINIIQSFKSCYFTFISLQTIAANRTHRKNTEKEPVNSKTVILIQHFIHKQFINIIQNNKILQIVHSFEKHLNFRQNYMIWASFFLSGTILIFNPPPTPSPKVAATVFVEKNLIQNMNNAISCCDVTFLYGGLCNGYFINTCLDSEWRFRQHCQPPCTIANISCHNLNSRTTQLIWNKNILYHNISEHLNQCRRKF